MSISQTTPTRLSNLQVELLKLYSYNVSEGEFNLLRDISFPKLSVIRADDFLQLIGS
jgi:hypothetical protein